MHGLPQAMCEMLTIVGKKLEEVTKDKKRLEGYFVILEKWGKSKARICSLCALTPHLQPLLVAAASPSTPCMHDSMHACPSEASDEDCCLHARRCCRRAPSS